MSTPGPGTVVTGFCWFSGSVQSNASEGSGSRLDRRSTPQGHGLDGDSEWRMIFAPGTFVLGCVWAVFSKVVRCGRGRSRVVRLPVIPSPPAWGGMEWYGRSQAGSIRIVDRATGRWGSDLRRPRVLAASRLCSRRSGQATDVPVA